MVPFRFATLERRRSTSAMQSETRPRGWHGGEWYCQGNSTSRPCRLHATRTFAHWSYWMDAIVNERPTEERPSNIASDNCRVHGVKRNAPIAARDRVQYASLHAPYEC